MGYRHQVISDTLVPNKKILPLWFLDKYSKFINFDMGYWASKGEYKRYGVLSEFEEDIQKMLQELNCDRPVRLVYFADESDYEKPDISHVFIDKYQILEENWYNKPKSFNNEFKALLENKDFVDFIKRLPIERMLEDESKNFAEAIVLDVICSAYKSKAGNILKVITSSGSFIINLGKYGL